MSIEQKLAYLYGDQVGQETYKKLKQRIAEFKPSANTFQLDEKDSILITYGDQIQKDGQSHLQSLKTFVDSKLNGAISCVHILPFYPYTSDDGFSVVDYLEVDPNLGNWSDVESLSDSSHLMFDAVINHCSKSSPWFKGYIEGDKKYDNFFHDMDPNEDLSQVTRPRALPLLTSFDSKTGTKNVWTTFSDDQVDLNYSNPEVLLSVIDVLLKYIEYGAKLIRLDAIAFLWKKVGTTCIHLPETHCVVKLIREVCDEVAPETVIITETNVPHLENISYFGNGNDEAHMVYNFSLPPLVAHSILRGRADILSNWARSLQCPSEKVCFFNFTASHDGVGVRPVTGILDDEELSFLVETVKQHGGKVSYKNNSDGTKSPYELNCCYIDILTSPDAEDSLRLKRFILSQAIMLSMPGVPGIYFHSLVGSRNDIEGMESSGINRRINREKCDYNNLISELNQSGSFRQSVFNAYVNLINLRKSEKAFHPFGAFSFPDIHPDLFCIERQATESEKILCLFNITNQSISIELDSAFSDCDDLIHSKKVQNQLQIAPYEFCWLKK